jgi:HlyD family secretion protein/adhesin transport system membrane fusion protein
MIRLPFIPSVTASDSQLRHLSQSARLEEALSPKIVRATMGVISLSVLAFIVWASRTNVYEIARSPGEVVPYGFQQVVQHLEGGIVREILVQEGQLVEQGDVLLRLDPADVAGELEQARARRTTLQLQAERLRAFIEDREPDFSAFAADAPDLLQDQAASFESMLSAQREERLVIEDQIEQKRAALDLLDSEIATAQENLRIVSDLHGRRQELSAQGHVSEVRLLETAQQLNEIRGDVERLTAQRELSQRELSEFEARLRSLDARHRSTAHENLDAVEAELIQVREVVRRYEDRAGRLDVRAPVRGLVKGLAVNTIGGVIGPGDVVMEIVPLDRPLVVQLKIPPRHIGHLATGQTVRVNFSSFDPTRYGVTEGRLDFVSATTFVGDDGERYYQGRVTLPSGHIGSNPNNLVMPGMTVMANIITGEKTILDYLLQPVRASMSTAFSER